MENGHSNPAVDFKRSPNAAMGDDHKVTRINSSLKQSDRIDAITLERVSDMTRLNALETDWNSLFETVANDVSVQDFNWTKQAYSHLLDKDEGADMVVLVGRHMGRVTMILPLVRYTRNGVVHLEFVTGKDGKSGSLLIESHPAVLEWLDRTFIFLLSAVEWDSLIFRKVEQHSLFLNFLKSCKALCLENRHAPTYTCILSRNIIGQAYSGLVQGHMAFHRLYDFLRSAYSSIL